jgi:hypothetical protein
LKEPNNSAAVVDRLKMGTRLNVIGSEGDWLIVHSRTKNITVYVRREDARLVSEKVTPSRQTQSTELKWKEIELQIQQAILKRGIPNITVSFIGDTAFLKGTVGSQTESQTAELAARTVPEVVHVHNGIWVQP